jgi:hypothetical protein
MKRLLLFLVFSSVVSAAEAPKLGAHRAVYASDGSLLPWTSWEDALDREMKWYLQCPMEHGYPRFITLTFMDGKYQPIEERKDTIPAMQNGMGIISYLKYYHHSGKRNPKVLEFARSMGDYLITESLTPDTGKYPRFTRSTGKRGMFPQPPDAGTQDDHPYEIEPDKGGIAGYALALLFEETRDRRYLDQAIHNARVLAANMQPGDDRHSPWPFRADYRTGEPRGAISGDMVLILRLFDKLDELGYPEFRDARARLWTWIKTKQVPNAAKDGSLWVEFFEDHHSQHNRTAWTPLNTARYLIEKKAALDPDWDQDARTLIEFVGGNLLNVRFGVAVCGEQDEDRNPWGGINSTYGAVLAMYAAATGSPTYKRVAEQALTFCLYAVEDNGCPRDSVLNDDPGGWQEDAHTDTVHNIVDALEAFPEWGRAKR